jgi:hypothetical protein
MGVNPHLGYKCKRNSLNIYFKTIVTGSGNQCDLTIQKDGLELQDGEYVIGLSGQINQIYCKALCSEPGPDPALKWYKTPNPHPVRMSRGRFVTY